MESLVPDLSKIPKAERIEEMVLKHVWPFQAQTHIFGQIFYLNRDKVSISTGCKHVLWYLKVVL
jgi:hypothetical protein